MRKRKITSSRIMSEFEAELRSGKNPDVKEYKNRYGDLFDEETRRALVAMKIIYDARGVMKMPDDFRAEQRKLVRSLIERDEAKERETAREKGGSPGLAARGDPLIFVELPHPLTKEVGPLPVISLAAAGQGQEYMVAEKGLAEITRPFDLPNRDAFGVEVQGNSMDPFLTAGSLVTSKPSVTVRSGDIALVETKGNLFWIKQVFFKDDKVTLHSFNPIYPDKEINKADILNIYRVMWIRRK